MKTKIKLGMQFVVMHAAKGAKHKFFAMARVPVIQNGRFRLGLGWM